MTEICLGAYETQADADVAMSERREPLSELSVRVDGDGTHQFRVWWTRP